MNETLDLKSCSPTSVISTPSILMVPFGSASLRRAANKDDFPAPVWPTIPTFKTKSSISRYNGIPRGAQFGGGFKASISNSGVYTDYYLKK